jgi:hypothetical protein
MIKKILPPLACSLLLSSCAVIFGRPEPGITVRERVQACFRQDEEGHVIAAVRPQTCYSMRCTRRIETSGTAVLDRRAFQIRFEPTFRFAETKPFLLPCTEDCLGAGELIFDLGVLDVGLYEVLIWDNAMGELSVTSGLPWSDQCLP